MGLSALGVGKIVPIAMLGDDGEGSVDGSHPTDLGSMRQADIFAQVLGPLLKAR